MAHIRTSITSFLIILLPIVFHFYIVKSIRIQNKNVKLHNQPQPLVTIKTEHGDIYDCIDIYEQPALNHPVLANHTIKMNPGKEFEDYMLAQELHIETQLSNIKNVSRIGLKKSCPFGTVPIRRYERVTSIKRSEGQLEFAGLLYTKNGEYHGSNGVISIYQPKIDVNSQAYSASILSIESGEGSSLNQIKVGWMVNPSLYGDNKVRMFISWTSDNYQSTGCYNLLCPGFVQTNPAIPVDQVLQPDNITESLALWPFVTQDKLTGAWILIFRTDYHSLKFTVVGYWPKNIFTSLGKGANTIKWGGEVFTPSSEDFSPPMGSGVFKIADYNSTCYWNIIMIVDSTFKFIPPDESLIKVSQSRCYFEGDHSYKSHGYYSFLFGGGGAWHKRCLFSDL